MPSLLCPHPVPFMKSCSSRIQEIKLEQRWYIDFWESRRGWAKLKGHWLLSTVETRWARHWRCVLRCVSNWSVKRQLKKYTNHTGKTSKINATNKKQALQGWREHCWQVSCKQEDQTLGPQHPCHQMGGESTALGFIGQPLAWTHTSAWAHTYPKCTHTHTPRTFSFVIFWGCLLNLILSGFLNTCFKYIIRHCIALKGNCHKAWCHQPIILAQGRLKGENFKCEVSLAL